ncbi:type II secretion system F family protein [Acinetobacter guillouiae]|uniref:type II secretion system F family protein n=1 Tax=Acinetobacter guillouiae TaxID=106649 RepID=UPI003AF6EF5A
MNDLILYACFIGLGGVISFLCWQIFSFVYAVPDENREYLDKPPFLFYVLWGLIKAISFYIKPFISKKMKGSLRKKIIYAGYDYVFKPSEIIASQVVFASVFSLLALIMLYLSGVELIYSIAFGLYGLVYPVLWLKSQKKKRENIILKEIPFFLDIIVLCVEAGLTLVNALDQSVTKAVKSPTRNEFSRVLADIRKGIPKNDALRNMTQRIDQPSVQNLVSAIIQAENMGMNLGPILRGQAEQRRVERFLRAEKLALEAPVKMLFPLVAFIFPCTFIVIGFPLYIMMKDAFG